MSRFDLGSSPGAGTQSLSPSGAGRGSAFGSAGDAERSGGYARPSAYQNNDVARAELSAPRAPMNTGAIQPDRYAGPTYQAPTYQTAAAQPVTQPVVAAGDTIEVRAGDTIYGLAKRHSVSVNDLLAANSGINPQALRLGQRLNLRAGASAGHVPSVVADSKFDKPAVKDVPAKESLATPTVVAEAAPADWTGSYTVKPGDSLYVVARQHSVKLADLQKFNGIVDVRRVKPGVVLKVPAGSADVAAQGVAADKTTESKPVDVTAKGIASGMEVAPIVPGPVVSGKSDASASSKVEGEKKSSSPQQPMLLNGGSASADEAGKGQVAGQKYAAAAPTIANDAAPAPPQGSVAGSMKLRWPVVGRVVSGFGPRADGTHNDGVNVAAPLGTEIHAAESGVVAYSGDELRGYGNLVLVRHENGWVTAYAHADEILVKRGDTVRRGQVIAKAGRTGQVDQPQVHFELRQGQKPVDPTPHMDKM